jgi:hypothetical protein
VNNPQRILTVLDRHLERPTRVILYGRAALVLGFPGVAPELGATMDVDAILPSVQMAAIESDGQFWRALDLANRELEPDGLYMTHLFSDEQVILSPDWLQQIVAPSAGVPAVNPRSGSDEDDARGSSGSRGHPVSRAPRGDLHGAIARRFFPRPRPGD